MQKWLLGACVATLFSTSAAAQQHFTFTANLNDSLPHGQITGTFDGTLNGNMITNLSNVSVTYNGTPFPMNGALNVFHYDDFDEWWLPNGATASLDGSQNNFLFIDGTFSGSHFTSFFYGSPWFGDRSQVNGIVSNTYGHSTFRAQLVAVPEPASWALMIGGIGMTGAALRIRRKPVARFA
ncbi:PEPxxWA-CTERM sorting domain-containing protein [Sphingomonas sp.]|uniref:PEPxxWA-CTERM sorting domain-containing protein n=1 Tax=Sphingomonas sp. TaxID=28214 RepID=UPI0028A8F14E|nr:PEPxxWA-CTERM sorting domain-containing protein [Sphingomonas sp.]